MEKSLGEIIPLKTMITKSIAKWKVVGEVSIFYMGNGYNFIKFTNALEFTRVLERQLLMHWSLLGVLERQP